MWLRSELKDRAKNNLRGKYWIAFVVALIASILGGESPRSFNFNFSFTNQDFGNIDFSQMISFMLPILISVITFASLFGLAFTIFVSYPITVGGYRWFSRSRESAATPSIGMVFSLFKSGVYLKTVGSMLWMNLFLFLWGLLSAVPSVVGLVYFEAKYQIFEHLKRAINNSDYEIVVKQFETADAMLIGVLGLASILLTIPVIVKTYSYRMTPWILADNPAIGYRRALKLSMQLTAGQKWRIFVLDLSFIGWAILGILACGIGILFAIPYFNATYAELYAVIRQIGVANGSCTMDEMGFVEVGNPSGGN